MCSPHVLAAVRELSRLEMVAETRRHALTVLAEIAPTWLRDIAPAEWFDRYSRRRADARLPQAKEERRAYGEQVGRDGHCRLQALQADGAPLAWHELRAIQFLQTMWEQQFVSAPDAQLRWRTADELAPAGDRVQSPYDPAARFSSKHALRWTGYKVFFTETCDEELPRLMSDVPTTPAPVFAGALTPPIEQALSDRGLAPGEHLVDSAYLEAEQILASQTQHGIALIGPVPDDSSWQTRAAPGYDASAFHSEWERKQAICPQGKRSTSWSEHPDLPGHPMVSVKFARVDCQPCPVRRLCTKARRSGRQGGIRLHPQHELLRHVRTQQRTSEWQARYHHRAGIEGLCSQATRCAHLRRARYCGLAKVRLEHLLIATALNLVRLGAWWRGEPLSATRVSAFAQLRAA